MEGQKTGPGSRVRAALCSRRLDSRYSDSQGPCPGQTPVRDRACWRRTYRIETGSRGLYRVGAVREQDWEKGGRDGPPVDRRARHANASHHSRALIFNERHPVRCCVTPRPAGSRILGAQRLPSGPAGQAGTATRAKGASSLLARRPRLLHERPQRPGVGRVQPSTAFRTPGT